MRWAQMVLLAGCTKAAVSTTPSGSSDSGHAGSASEEMEGVGLHPYTTIRGRTAAEIGGEYSEIVAYHMALLGDVWGDGHLNLTTTRVAQALVFRGLPGPGEVTTDAVAATITGGETAARPAGDVNADGYDDLWLGSSLYVGPLPADTDYTTGWHARIGGGLAGLRTDGDFDADGDGHVDAIVFDDDHQAVVYYGPFEPGSDRLDWFTEGAHLSQLTRFDAGCGSGNDIWSGWVRADFFGPGRAGLALVNKDSAGDSCLHAVELFDMSGPRGRDIDSDQAVAWHGFDAVRAGGDYDGDGHQDLTYHHWYAGPFEGHLPWPDEQRVVLVFDVEAEVVGLTGDMTGDGLSELLVVIYDEQLIFYVLPSTHLGDAVDVRALGVAVNPLGYDFRSSGWLSGDLDGDGKAELVLGNAGREEGGRIFIWRGADIFP